MTINESLNKVLFSAPCAPICSNPNCEHAVAMLPETERWYITFGHCGFNSYCNNHLGYSTKEKAMSVMRNYRNKILNY